jgi:hypothetical protein
VLLCGWFSVESVLGERPILNIETYLRLKSLPCAHAEKLRAHFGKGSNADDARADCPVSFRI